jgi:hypothetical protein
MLSNLEVFSIFFTFFLSILILKVVFNNVNYKWKKIILFIDSLITVILLLISERILYFIWFWEIESRITDTWIQKLIFLSLLIWMPYLYINYKKKLLTKYNCKPTSEYWIIEFFILFLSFIIMFIWIAIL